MEDLCQRRFKDKTGLILLSEMDLVGTVGVLGMVVGLESIAAAVNQELYDLWCAHRLRNQTYNYRSIFKGLRVSASGSGYTDLAVGGNNCGMTQTYVNGGGEGDLNNNEF